MKHVTIFNPTHPPLSARGGSAFGGKLRGGERRGYEKIISEVLIRAARFVRCPRNTVVSVIFIGDAKMRALNRRYRGKDRTTNVLAFEGGDIFISLPEARREAKKYGWTPQYSVARLALHGFLHVLGYDHVRKSERVKMERIEAQILARV